MVTGNNSQFKLYGPSESIQIRKCVAVANRADIDFGHSHSKPGDDTKGTFLMVSPLSIYPALHTPNGVVVGSNAICNFFAQANPIARLTGRDIFEHAAIQGMVETAANVLEVALYKKIELGQGSADAEIEKYLNYLDGILEKKTFLVGERQSFADVAIAIVVKHAEQAGISLTVPVTRWVNTILADPKVAKAMNTKASTGVSPRKNNKKAPAKKAAPKAEEAKVEEAKVEEAPEVEAAAPSAVDMGHPALRPMDVSEFNPKPAEPAPVSEGGINLEVWKRDYSNSKTPEDYAAAFEKFWAQYKPEDYTIWKMVYDKVEGECTKDYLTSNLLNGFLQRMDPAARKNGFGICNVLGVDGDFNYEGVFIFRGTEMPFFMIDHPSFEYHKFAKIDVSDETQRKIVFDMWTAEDDINGRPIVDCKQFK